MCFRVFLVLFLVIFINSGQKVPPFPAQLQPHYNNRTNCEDFAQNARFNPYSVLNVWWFVFYYWDMPRDSMEMYHFYVPTAKLIKDMQKVLDGRVSVPVNWTSRLVMMSSRDNMTSLLVEKGDRGEYWAYSFSHIPPKGMRVQAEDIRLKQTGDNRLLGFMDCQTKTLLVMCKIYDIPDKKDIQDEAARMGFVGTGARSYLYQGSDWMPTYEMDEHDYWLPPDVLEWKTFERDQRRRNRRQMKKKRAAESAEQTKVA